MVFVHGNLGHACDAKKCRKACRHSLLHVLALAVIHSGAAGGGELGGTLT